MFLKRPPRSPTGGHHWPVSDLPRLYEKKNQFSDRLVLLDSPNTTDSQFYDTWQYGKHHDIGRQGSDAKIYDRIGIGDGSFALNNSLSVNELFINQVSDDVTEK